MKDMKKERSFEKTPPMPKYAWLSFTGRCNLSCVHCPSRISGKEPHDAEDMSPDLFSKIEREVFPHLQVCKIGGNNNGEQLFARDWDPFMERMKGYPFSLWLITNGTKLHREQIRALVERESIIDISIEAATEKTYRRIRGTGLPALIENVKAIEEERILQKKRCELRFSFTAFQENITELCELLRLAKELKADRVCVTHITPMSPDQRYQSLIFHRALSNQCLEEARELADEIGLTLDLPPLFPLGDMTGTGGPTNDLYPWLTKKCFHPWTTVSLNEKGDVTPCCISNTVMGNLGEQSLGEIWGSRMYRNLRKRVNSRDPWVECRRCVLRGEKFTSVHCIDEEALLWVVGPWQHVDKTLIQRALRERIRDSSMIPRSLVQWIRKAKGAP